MPYLEMRQAIISWCDNKSSLNIDEFMHHYRQPREPVKRALDELCIFDKTTKSYTLKMRR
jgi:hypothetical protein